MFFYEDTKVVVSYLPVWEMFFSMHVLAEPAHHVSRRKWSEAKKHHFPELTNAIRELNELTGGWLMVIDSENWDEIRQMEIIEMLTFFRKKDIYQWNRWIKHPEGKEMSREDRDRVLKVMEEYYETIFRKEEIILRPYLLRAIREEKEKCRKEGLWNWCKSIHPRLCVGQDTLIYRKNREYQYEKKAIGTVFLTASTFVHPHLWLYKSDRGLEIVKDIMAENADENIPEDFAMVFKALGDKTRLKIIRLLLQRINTTQALSREMQLSEAAVSKHLKILWEAGLVGKVKKGFYTEYEFKTEMIDFIPYRFYETMLF